MPKSFSYSFVAVDKFSKIAEKVKAKSKGLARTQEKMARAADKARRAFVRMGKAAKQAGNKMKGIGRGVALAVSAPAAAIIGKSLVAWDLQEKAIADVANALRTTGGTAKLTLQQLKDAASDLQKNSLFGDEDILKNATAQLLTFQDIASDVFLRTQVLVADFAAKQGTDLKSNAILLGKALGDPVTGISALTRVGAKFDDVQKGIVKGLARTNRMAEAQAFILDELEVQYGGTAAAAAKAGLGPLQQLAMRFGDISEGIGKQLLPILQPLIDKFAELATWFEKMSPAGKKTTAIILLAAVVVGPLIIAFGALLTMIPFMVTGFGLIAGVLGAISLPVVAVIAGLAALGTAAFFLWDNWETVSGNIMATLQPLIDGFNSVVSGIASVSPSNLIGGAADAVSDFFSGDGGLAAAADAASDFFSGEIDVKGGHSTTDVNVVLQAPAGTVKSISSRTTGKPTGKIGVGMVQDI